ncbi:syntaxin binding protein 1, partial [Coemansia nantahalensis]
MCAPLLHDFSYQAIVHDLLDLESGRKYIYEAEGADGQTRRVEAELTEDTDELWKKFRHWHIADVSQALADEFEQLVSKSEEIQIACKGMHCSHKMGVRQMKAALSGLPDFRRLQDAYSLHIDLASKCLGIIKQGILTTLSDFEQASFAHPPCRHLQRGADLISGKDSLGEDVGREALEMRLISLLDDHTLDASDRIRILFIYLVCVNGGAALDRRRLEEVPQCMSTNDKRAA